MDAYTSFARVYDTFMDNVPYQEWADYLQDLLIEYGIEDGLLLDLGCGTAAVISPVGKVVDHGKEICFPSGMEDMGPITKKLYDTLTGIQMGRIEAPEGWIHEVC